MLNKEDTEIWQYAKQNDFLIVTFDADFYEISLTQGFSPKIIWLRTGNLTTIQIANLILSHKNVILEFSLNENNTCLEIE